VTAVVVARWRDEGEETSGTGYGDAPLGERMKKKGSKKACAAAYGSCAVVLLAWNGGANYIVLPSSHFRPQPELLQGRARFTITTAERDSSRRTLFGIEESK